MFQRLSVKNFALFEQCDIELAPGLNALTGETGAGKSLLIDALECVLGARTSPDLIRLGEEAAMVEAFVTVEDPELLGRVNELLGFESESTEFLVRRKLARSGRFAAEINGRSVPLAMLRQLGDLLVDIHGQNEHQRLIQPSVQLDALDAFAGLTAERTAYVAAYGRLVECARTVATLRQEHESLQREQDFLEHRVGELEAAKIGSDDELDELAARRNLIAHHQQVFDAVSELCRRVYQDDDSVTSILERICVKLSKLSDMSPDIDRWAKLIDQAALTLNEAGREAGDFLASADWSPGELERTDDRIAQLRSLCRKYGPSLADCRAALAAEKTRLQSLASIDVRLEDAGASAETARKELLEASKRLSTRRRAAAGKLAGKVEAELSALGMKQARFRIDFTVLTQLASADDVRDASPSGLDACEFMLLPNPGEGWAPLRKIASGGEIARAMLAIKSVLAGTDRTPVLVFDEIDADVGGRLGDSLGAKLRAISGRHQVLVVTHLPQIAAFAHRQFGVEKVSHGGRTFATARQLEGKTRLEELAEMLRGKRKAAEAMDQARKMLASANIDR